MWEIENNQCSFKKRCRLYGKQSLENAACNVCKALSATTVADHSYPGKVTIQWSSACFRPNYCDPQKPSLKLTKKTSTFKVEYHTSSNSDQRPELKAWFCFSFPLLDEYSWSHFDHCVFCWCYCAPTKHFTLSHLVLDDNMIWISIKTWILCICVVLLCRHIFFFFLSLSYYLVKLREIRKRI